MVTTPAPRWALEPAVNLTVLRLHVDVELTTRTILTCPPHDPPPIAAAALAIAGVRSVDLHRYRARLNLQPGVIAADIVERASAQLARSLGPVTEMLDDEGPVVFEVDHDGPRHVAESVEMADRSGEPTLVALFGVHGVAEAILGDGLVLVRLGRLFRWHDGARSQVIGALESAARTST
jgi:hypothetical protein